MTYHEYRNEYKRLWREEHPMTLKQRAHKAAYDKKRRKTMRERDEQAALALSLLADYFADRFLKP